MNNSISNSASSVDNNSYTDSQLALLRNSVYFFTGTKSVLCLFGIVLNVLLIYVTIRAKWLHGICNILLALYDASIIAYLTDVPIYLIQITLGVSSMEQYDCFIHQIVPLFTFCASFPLMLSIAIDRFIGVVFPIRYKSFNKWASVGIALLMSSFYSSFYIFAAYQNATIQPHKPIACTTITPLGSAIKTLAKTNFVIELVAIFVYLGLWLYMNRLDKKMQKENGNSVVPMRRLFKSLFTILLVDFAGWSTNSLSITVLDLIGVSNSRAKSDQMLYYFITSSLNYLAYVSSSSNAIFLYCFSQEYKRAFDKYLPGWMITMKNRICCKCKAVIVPQNLIMVVPNPPVNANKIKSRLVSQQKN